MAMLQTIYELEGLSVADVMDLLEDHKIGHRLAMEYFGYESYHQLVDTMHANGRIMPGHQKMRIAPETLALIKQIVRKPASPSAPAKKSAPRKKTGPKKKPGT